MSGLVRLAGATDITVVTDAVDTVDALDALDITQKTWLCGTCSDKGTVWCPDCWGFGGSVKETDSCEGTGTLPCPECAGGTYWPLAWW